jgi:hypothetical protein
MPPNLPDPQNIHQRIERRVITQLAQLQPVVMEIRRLDAPAVKAERMEVLMPQASPVPEFDPELEGCTGLANEIILIEAEQLIKSAQRRNGGPR